MASFYRTFLIALGQALVVLALFFPPPVSAATPVEKLTVLVELNPHGAIEVHQTIEYVSPSTLDWAVFSNPRGLTVATDQGTVPNNEITRRGRSGKTVLDSKHFATTWQLSYQAPGGLIRHNNRDQLFLKIIDQPDRPIYQTEVRFLLPELTGQETSLAGNVYAISGVTEPTTEVASSRELLVTADYIGPKSLMTLSATWNKNILSLSALDQAGLALLELDAAPWLALGLLLPLAGVIVFLQLLWHQKSQERVTQKATNKPPSNLPAVLVGVLVRKKIYPEEIAALLIDLCQRGYLLIVKRSDNYYLVQRKMPDEQLEGWEKEIIEEMFAANQTKFSDKQLHDLGSHTLYSPRVRDAFRQIYQVITEKSYFQENPHVTRIRIKLIALALYYASALGMIWVAVAAGSPYLILPLAGTMLVAILIIKAATHLANYSQPGTEASQQWHSFGNFLRQTKPLPFELARNHTFEKFLPYAVALNATLPWAKRFDYSSIAVLKPDWFVTYEESSTVEFASEIIRFTNHISEGITSLRGPLVS